MTIRQLIAELSSMRREINQRKSEVQSFMKTNSENLEFVRSYLAGGTQQREKNLLSSISAVESSLKKTNDALTSAENSIARVQLI